MKTKLSILVAVLCVPGIASGQIFWSDMDDGTDWTVNVSSGDTTWEFGWDFTSMGIPPSPTGSTTGLRMAANMEYPSSAEKVVATPTDLTIGGRYTIDFDFWGNVNGPLPGGGSGSTEFVGGGIGYDGTTPDRNGAMLIITGEGGSSRDWRLYKNTGEQFVASGQYDVDTNNNWGADLSAYFPPQSPPQYQQDNYPQQTGETSPGCGGFTWHHMTITVDSDAIGIGYTEDPGIANFTVDGLSIGTVDNSNGGTVVAMTGNVQVMYADLFSSVSDNADLSFGVIDNFVVTRPLVDIKPGSCPNPFNRKSHGVLPVALLGTAETDLTQIDVSSIRLSRVDGIGGEVAPNEGPPGPHTVFEDVGTPFAGEPCDCDSLGGDGIDDLSMKFRSDDVVEMLELNANSNGDEVELKLTGTLLNGIPMTFGSDCILIVPMGSATLNVESNVSSVFVEVCPTNCGAGQCGFTGFQRFYNPGTAITLTAPASADGVPFVGWVIDGEGFPTASRTLSVTLVESNTTAEALYVPTVRVPAPAPTPTPVPRPVPRPVIR